MKRVLTIAILSALLLAACSSGGTTTDAEPGSGTLAGATSIAADVADTQSTDAPPTTLAQEPAASSPAGATTGQDPADDLVNADILYEYDADDACQDGNHTFDGGGAYAWDAGAEISFEGEGDVYTVEVTNVYPEAGWTLEAMTRSDCGDYGELLLG